MTINNKNNKDKLTDSEKKKKKKEKKAKTNPEKTAANKEKADAKPDIRKKSGSTKVVNR